MAISYQSVAQTCITMYAAPDLTEGIICRISADDTVGVCDDGDAFCGVTVGVKDKLCGVIVGGFVTVAYTGTAPAAGWQGLSANDTGGVRADTTGKAYLVTRVNTADSTVTFLL